MHTDTHVTRDTPHRVSPRRHTSHDSTPHADLTAFSRSERPHAAPKRQPRPHPHDPIPYTAVQTRHCAYALQSSAPTARDGQTAGARRCQSVNTVTHDGWDARASINLWIMLRWL